MYHCQVVYFPTTGNITKTMLPFTPTRLRFSIEKTDATRWVSTGEATTAAQEANSNHFDVVPAGEFLQDATKCMFHHQRNSGVLTPALVGSFVSFGIKRYTVNMTVANANIPVFVEMWG